MLEKGFSLLQTVLIISIVIALQVVTTCEKEEEIATHKIQGGIPNLKFGGRETKLIESPSGKISGEVFILADGSTGVRYLGIPFALPPINERRFMNPQPAPPWPGVFEAMQFGPICYQPLDSDVWDMELSEDLVKDQSEYDPQRPISSEEQKRLQEKLKNQIHEVEDLMTEMKWKKNFGNVSQDLNWARSTDVTIPEEAIESKALEKYSEAKKLFPRSIRSFRNIFSVNKTISRHSIKKLEKRKLLLKSSPPVNNSFSKRTKRKTEVTKIEKNKLLYLQEKYLRDYTMSEDCLTLNIYTPLIPSRMTSQSSATEDGNPSKKYPVVVYIHGGSFYSNGGRLYPGERLAAEGVIVVTFNYRLGPFGFLSTADSEARGNWGLQDQLMVLKWVNKNIPSFGGDTNKILLTGNSAGASSVVLLMLSPLSKGLFNRVAALSGCALAPWSIQRTPVKGVRKLASGLKCPIDSSKEVIKCLKTKDAEAINKEFTFNVIEDGLWLSFAPVIEGDVPGAFLPSDPREMLTKGNFHKVPLLLSLTQDEVTIWFRSHSQTMKKHAIEEWMNDIIKQIYSELDNPSLSAVSHAIRGLYIYSEGYTPSDLSQMSGKRSPSAKEALNVEVPVRVVANLFSDVGLRVPCIEEALILSDWTSIYVAEFTYASKDDVRVGNQKWIGSYHESDLQYIFGQPLLGLQNSLRHEQDKVMARLAMTMVTSFAATGVPSIKPVRNVTWPKFNRKNNFHLEMNDNPQLRQGLMQSKLYFWQHFLPLLVKWPVQLLPSAAPRLDASFELLFLLLISALLFVYDWTKRHL